MSRTNYIRCLFAEKLAHQRPGLCHECGCDFAWARDFEAQIKTPRQLCELSLGRRGNESPETRSNPSFVRDGDIDDSEDMLRGMATRSFWACGHHAPRQTPRISSFILV